MQNKKTIIELNSDESCFIINSKGTIKFYSPNKKTIYNLYADAIDWAFRNNQCDIINTLIHEYIHSDQYKKENYTD